MCRDRRSEGSIPRAPDWRLAEQIGGSLGLADRPSSRVTRRFSFFTFFIIVTHHLSCIQCHRYADGTISTVIEDRTSEADPTNRSGVGRPTHAARMVSVAPVSYLSAYRPVNNPHMNIALDTLALITDPIVTERETIHFTGSSLSLTLLPTDQ